MTQRHTMSAALALAVALAAPARAADAPKPAPRTAPEAAAPRSAAASLAALGLPEYHEPAAYRVNLVIHSSGRDMVLRRFIDGGRIRSEIAGGEAEMTMIELGDEQGTNFVLMPDEKRAIRQTRGSLDAMTGEDAKPRTAAKAGAATAADIKVENLGEETREGRALRKLRITSPEGASLGWFDVASGAPVRVESNVNGETASIDWKDYQVGPQPAKLFEIPKDYEVTDMDEVAAQMKKMGGMKGMGGMGGMGGMRGGMGGMMGGMGQSMGAGMGGGLGSALGGALGGPLGSVAGQYIGGKVGGMVGRKAADIVTPGK